MNETKLYNRILLAFFWQLFVLSIANSQPIRTHSGYFKAALDAKTLREIAAYTQKACELAIKEHQIRMASNYYLQISDRCYQQQYYLLGIQQAQKGLDLLAHYSIRSDTLSFKYCSLLASMYSRLTMNDSASYWYTRTEKLLQSKSQILQLIPEYIEAYYYNKGFFFIRLGDQERASGYILKSVEMAEAIGNKRSIALSYQQLANYYFLIRQYQQATIYYQKSLARFTPESVDACWGYALLGNCLRANNKLIEGLWWLRISKEKYALIVAKKPSGKDSNFEIESNYYLGKCEQLAGLDQEAIQSFQTSIDTYRQVHGTKGELIAASWSGLATIALKQHQFTKALALVQQALIASTVLFTQTNTIQNPDSDDIKAGKALYEALRLKGAIFFQFYKNSSDLKALKEAIQAFRVGLQVAQRIRRSFTGLESTYFFNEKIHPSVDDALEAIFELQTQPKASQQEAMIFDLLQSYQAMGMADVLHDKAIKRETIPAEILQQEHDLRQKLATAETTLLTTQVPISRQGAIAKLGEIKRQLYFFDDELAHKYPRYYALKYDNKTISIAELQDRLDGQTAYLSYFLSGRFIYGFFATKDRVRVFRRVTTPVFSHAVSDLRKILERNPGMFDYEGRAASNRLFDYLIRPVEPHLAIVKRLIVERDDILNNIPFEVLESSEKPNDYLCKRFALSYSYSAKLTFTPTLTETPLHPVGFAPYSEDSIGREKPIAYHRLLQKSAAEVRAAGGTVYLNGQATKARFLQVIRTANLLHLATHAYANDSQPEASSIGFYPYKPDSLLRALEIVNLPLDQVQLVVLSACEGNRGVLRKAEGLLSLARAFRLAGCPTILTTSWTAHNETTSELMRLFYKHLHQGLSADIALQRARIDYFESPEFKKWGHPYYWANFTLLGNPDVAFSATNASNNWLLIVVVMLVSLCLFLLFRRLATKPVS